MKKVILFILIFATVKALAQGSNIPPTTLPTPIFVSNFVGPSYAKSVNGSPYFDEAYHKGELWTSNNLHFTDEVVYKFNEVENTVLIKTKEGKELLVGAKVIDSCRLYMDDKTTVYFYKASFLNTDKWKDKICQVVYAGKKITVYKIPHKTFEHKEYQGNIGDGRSMYAYVSRDDYFIKVGSKPITKLKLSKKDIMDKIPHKRNDLKEEFDYIEFLETITEKKLVAILKKIE
jgi:hypothetical protein